MNKYSNNTRLLNCLIALANKTPDFPNPLYVNGFQLETIEPKILFQDGTQANPDIQFKKNDNQLAFFECKSGSCEKRQLEIYRKMTLEDIKRSKITSLSIAKLNLFDLAYFGIKENEDKLNNSILHDGNPFPIIILDDKKICRISNSSLFNDNTLNDIFNEITFERPVPTCFVPFCASDNDDTITICLLQHFVSLFEYSFTLDDLLKDLFSHFIHHYSTKGKKELKSRIGRLLSRIMQDDEFSDVLSYNTNTNTYQFRTTGPAKYKRKCEAYIKNCEKKSKEHQISKIEDFLDIEQDT